MTRSASACLALLLLLQPPAATSWAARGHSVIDRTAINALPDDGPVFLKKYTDYIAASASIPDSWRNYSEPFSKIEEDPNHGWFREQFAFMKDVPRSRYELVIELYKRYEVVKKTDPEAAKLMNVRWTGTLPYAAAEVYGRLTSNMRQLRRARSANKDTTALEQTCAFEVAWLGHYIGDGAEPLHDTIHHNGWLGPNPNGYATDSAVHSRFESVLVDKMQLSEADLMPRLGKPQHLDGDVFDQILGHLTQAGSRVEAIYKIDKRGALTNPADPEAREMVLLCASDGARMLRDLVYRAWLESDNTPKIPAAATDKNPRYNPETGTAPAYKAPAKI